jgi:hypothetical protein
LPARVLKTIRPLVAPRGTTATILVGDTTWNRAFRPWNVTAVAPRRFAPVIVMRAPTTALRGRIELIDGSGSNAFELVARPVLVVTVTRPIPACFGTLATIDVALLTAKRAARPSNRTLEAPDRFVPWITTLARARPCPGESERIAGIGSNGVDVLALPAGVTTVSSPGSAHGGTVTEICVADFTLKPELPAGIPSKSTFVASARFVPVIVTCVPATPEAGENNWIAGSGLKLPLLQP